MKQFAKLDQHGFVIKRFNSQNSDEPGCVEIQDGQIFSIAPNKVKHLGSGRFQVTDETWMPSPDYDLARVRAYPSVGDQLDALWKAIGPLIEHPEAEGILARIQAVKDANPKPSN